MLTNDQLQQLLEMLPELEARSRLDPFRDLIMEMRRRGYSYRDISRFLIERCGVGISHNAVRNFVNRDCAAASNPRPACSGEEQRTRKATEAALPAPSATHQPQGIRDRIDALKRRPQPGPAKDQAFRFDPAQPLTLPED
jgi:hypothetical protein